MRTPFAIESRIITCIIHETRMPRRLHCHPPDQVQSLCSYRQGRPDLAVCISPYVTIYNKRKDLNVNGSPSPCRTHPAESPFASSRR
jgi:hypothetical protein